MVEEKLNDFKIILASKSPRRRYLLKELGVNFEVCDLDNDETYPIHLVKDEIADYLASAKAMAFPETKLQANTLVITADTIVWHQKRNLGKPKDRPEAYEMLKCLSGDKHTVITGVCLRTLNKLKTFTAATDVWFKILSDEEIYHYIDNYSPYDKAGSYGIQEWIGYIGIKGIRGSYFNVMGLPVQKLYEELLKF